MSSIRHTVFLFWLVFASWSAYVFGNVLGPDPGHSGVAGVYCNVAGCHVGNPLNASGGSVILTGLPANWSPDTSYSLTVTVTRAGQRRFGFQMTAVGANGQQAGTFSGNCQGRCSVVTASVGGVQLQHVQHTVLGSQTGAPNTFTFTWRSPASTSAGNVRFNVAANAANGDANNTGDFIYQTSATVPPVVTTLTNTFYFPQIADGTFTGGFWRTTILLTNPASSGSPATGAVTFTQSSGAPFLLTFLDSDGRTVNSPISFDIPPGGTRSYVSQAASPLAVGWAVVSSASNVVGSAIFSQFAGATTNARLVAEAGVPALTAGLRQSIFVDTTSGFKTGLAYANPGSSAARITLRLLSTEGAEVVAPISRTLEVSQHTAAFVHELFPGAPPLIGTMQITSDVPLTTVALRFDPSFTLFTTLPPTPLAVLIEPVMGWLHRMSSEIALLTRRFDLAMV